MSRVCPNPIPWNNIFQQLTSHAGSNSCVPEFPPKPLILAGWAYSSDLEKAQRWEETVAWANFNGCASLVDQLKEEDFYFGESGRA
jgi:hypothetical protein